MKTYTIKELSEQFGLPASTLRYYEEEGLLTDVGRAPEKQRVYGERHVGRLETIRCFKGTGMSIAQLRELFRYEEDSAANAGEILALLRGQREHVQAEICRMQENLTHVERKIRRYEAILESAENGGN